MQVYEKNSTAYDAVFLDMEMGGIDGMETANIIREYDKHVIVVFITSFTKYMQKSFECMPFRFLNKPVSYEDITKVVGDIRCKLHEDVHAFVFETNRRYIRLLCENIIYFESHSHNVAVHTIDGKYKITKPLSQVIKILGNDMFFRTHKSYIVSCNYVKEILEKEIVLYDTDVHIPLSRSYRKQFIEGFIGFEEKKYMII